MKEDKISIIVPSYNQGSYIENVIKSTLNQTYSEWELIIQDGASKDNTKEICEKYALLDNRIIFFSEPDKGFADAVNKAIDKATGKWAIIQSSDDFFASPYVFEEMLNISKQFKSLKIISGSAVVIDDNFNHLKTGDKKESIVHAESVYTLKDNFSQGATFFLLDRAKEIGKLDPTVDMVADTDFWIRYCCYYPIHINSIYQTARIWCCVLIQPNQRSAVFSNFYLGRVKMSIKHLSDSNIKYTDEFKRKQADQLIESAFSHFNLYNIDLSPLKKVYEKFYNKTYLKPTPIRHSPLKTWVKRKLGIKINDPSFYTPNSISEIYTSNNNKTGYNYKWF